MGYVEFEEEEIEHDGVDGDGRPFARTRTVRLGFTRTWMPQCSVHPGDDWCSHIEEWIKDGDDASLFWDDVAPIDMTGVPIPVPVIPTADQWVNVRFGEFNSAVRAYPIELYTEIMSADQPGIFLGFIGLGEGRLVMRQMVWQWFQGYLATVPKIVCSDRKHGFKEQLVWEKAMNDPKRNLEEAFCVTNKGSCMACSARKEADTFDDLVPF
jgi:hypothetical protein